MLTSEDRHGIQELYTRYCWSIDTGDAATWVDTFTEDGVFESNGQVTSGRAALAEWVRKRLEFRVTEPTVNGQHFVANLDADGDARRARVRCYFLRTVQSRESGAVQITAAGWFDDLLHMDEDGRWRFRHHVVCKQMPWHGPQGTPAEAVSRG